MKRNMNEWQTFISEIRRWDRQEHNWAGTNKRMPHENLVTQNDFIHSLMREYKLTKRKRKRK
jgi:hypothetical protein